MGPLGQQKRRMDARVKPAQDEAIASSSRPPKQKARILSDARPSVA
jgi:hypothetical protein